MEHLAGHIEDNVISTPGQPYQRVVLRARHNESFCAFDVVVKSLYVRRGICWNNIAPELGTKADDKVHATGGRPGFTNCRDSGGELIALVCVQEIELEVGVLGRSESEYPGLGRVHARIIRGCVVLPGVPELGRFLVRVGDFGAIFVSTI